MIMEFTVPQDNNEYVDFVDNCLQLIIDEAGVRPQTFTWKESYNGRCPMLMMDFYRYSHDPCRCCLNLPPDTPARSEARADTLLNLFRAALS